MVLIFFFLNRICISQICSGSEALDGVLWDLWNLKRTRKLLKYWVKRSTGSTQILLSSQVSQMPWISF